MNERIFLEMIRAACLRHDVQLTAYSDGWLLRMEKDGSTRHIVGANFDLNSQAAAAIARDKAATSALLGAAGIDHVAHTVLRSSNMHSIHESHLTSLLGNGDVVMKPLEGGKGDYVARISSVQAARQLASQTQQVSWAVSPYVEIDKELRLVVIDGSVRLGYAKTDPVVIDNLKFFNLSKGAKAESLDIEKIPTEICALALSATKAIGLRMAAVDLVVESDNQVSVLEVNAGFSLTYHAQTNKATYREVALLYERLIVDMFAT